jgi:GNAT superfamily N-acetyltransferase
VKISVGERSPQHLLGLHELYRQEANCQVIRDSFWGRGLLDAYAVEIDGRLAGHGAVSNRYDKGRLIEFYTLPEHRRHALLALHELLPIAKPTHFEAQSNIGFMSLMLHDCATNIKAEKVLFHDAFTTHLPPPHNAQFRPLTEAEQAAMREAEAIGDYVLEVLGEIVGRGGFLCHYNPPYGDVFMDVREPHRRRGFGSYLVQEIKRVCYENGKSPAARCDIENAASRATLEKAGLLACGHLLVGRIKPAL